MAGGGERLAGLGAVLSAGRRSLAHPRTRPPARMPAPRPPTLPPQVGPLDKYEEIRQVEIWVGPKIALSISMHTKASPRLAA